MFDADGGGSITHAELRQKMLSSGTDITCEEIDEIIKEADKDGDGEINLIGKLLRLLVTRLKNSSGV